MKTDPKRERATVAQTPDSEDSRLDKLPVWAQTEIVNLRRALREARQERDEALSAPPSNTSIQRLSVDDGPKEVFLPDGALVRFYLSPPGPARRFVDVNVSRAPHRPTHLRVASPSGQIAAFPIASNALNIMETDDAP